jgi:small-conductance mechanosensitive channel/CRP-like cAMP-binding protein
MSDPASTIRQIASLQGVAVACTIVLLLLSLAVLPREERRELRLPLLLLIAHVLVGVGTFALGPGKPSRGVVIAMVLLLFTALARVSFLLVVDWLIGKRLNRPLSKIFRDILQALFFIAVALIALHELGFEPGSLLTTSAILTAVLGLSLQEVLGNLFAGLAVQTERPFEVGDWIQVGDGQTLIGQVVELNWRTTKLQTNDLTEIVVPNAMIAKSSIRNFRRPEPITRRLVAFQAPYEVTPNRVERAVLGCMSHVPGVAESRLPELWTDGFEDSGIGYQLVYFITDFAARKSIESEVRNRIWYALARAGISMPYPTRDLRVTRAHRPPLDAGLVWTKEQSAEVLGQVEFFEFLPEGVRQHLADLATAKRYGRSEPIVVEGAAGDGLFVVAEGRVAVKKDGPAGENLELASLGPGSLFGELSLLTGTRQATVSAAIESVVLRISHDDFRDVVEQVPGLQESLLVQLTERSERLARPDDTEEVPSSVEFRQAIFSRIRRLFSAS